MKGNPCTNHPDKDLKEIEPGTRFCERCRNLVALDWKPIPKPIPKIVQEMALEEELEVEIEEAVNVATENEEVIEQPVDTGPEVIMPVEAEPELSEAERLATAQFGLDNAKKAEIAALRAKLAELEK